MCLLTNERYVTYQTVFSFDCLGHAKGVGLGVGGQKFNFSKFKQIWCVIYSHEWHVQRHNYFGPASWGPREGKKGQISLNNYVNFKDF